MFCIQKLLFASELFLTFETTFFTHKVSFIPKNYVLHSWTTFWNPNYFFTHKPCFILENDFLHPKVCTLNYLLCPELLFALRTTFLHTSFILGWKTLFRSHELIFAPWTTYRDYNHFFLSRNYLMQNYFLEPTLLFYSQTMFCIQKLVFYA